MSSPNYSAPRGKAVLTGSRRQSKLQELLDAVLDATEEFARALPPEYREKSLHDYQQCFDATVDLVTFQIRDWSFAPIYKAEMRDFLKRVTDPSCDMKRYGQPH